MAPHDSGSADIIRVLVTGANSGLGFGICQRLIDTFLKTFGPSKQLCIIITTRDERKGSATVHKLNAYLEHAETANGKSGRGRVTIQPEILDLTSMLSVQRLAKKLSSTLPSLDSLLLNAGIGGATHLRWGALIYAILTDFKYALTYPRFKGAGVGWLTKPQTRPGTDMQKRSHQETALGEIFCANVFGHYLLAHYLAPLLARSQQGNGRIIWLSSLEAYPHAFKPGDFQGLTHELSYESSKRLTDILALTSKLPPAVPCVQQFLAEENGLTEPLTTPREAEPKQYVCHPGVCATGIFPLPWMLAQLMYYVFFLARWVGSIWHVCTPYKGACAPVWVALSDQSVLDAADAGHGRQKYGSATDFWGNERVEATEVDGWGYGGTVQKIPADQKGRWRYAKDLTTSARQDFEVLGGECWHEIERLRHAWEQQVSGASNGA